MSLFLKKNRPYFILAPSYTHKSSGVRTLHLLCHALNSIGESAFLCPFGNGSDVYKVNHSLSTPIVDADDDEAVAIYPDIIRGNPLNKERVVRYLLGPTPWHGEFAETDSIWGYTTSLAKKYNTKNIILLPTFDRNIFHVKENKIFPRSGSCFYSHKYDKIHGNKLLPVTDKSIRIENMKPDEVSEVLNRTEVCYVYEMSEIIVNAGLCGCPVRLVRTPYFNNLDEDIDFDFPHVSWDDTGEKVKTLGKSIEKIMEDFPYQLRRFVNDTQSM
jgi:hypothetical protein